MKQIDKIKAMNAEEMAKVFCAVECGFQNCDNCHCKGENWELECEDYREKWQNWLESEVTE